MDMNISGGMQQSALTLVLLIHIQSASAWSIYSLRVQESFYFPFILSVYFILLFLDISEAGTVNYMESLFSQDAPRRGQNVLFLTSQLGLPQSNVPDSDVLIRQDAVLLFNIPMAYFVS